MTILRKLGIELECFHPTLPVNLTGDQIENGIKALGFPAKNQRNHFATEYDKWQIKPDSSLAPRGFALEVVARTLPGTEESLTEIRKVAQWLSSNGFDVNQSCGYHVHIDCSDLSLAEIAAVSFRYNARRAEFNAILPRSRHSSSYAQPLVNDSLSKVRRAVLGQEETWDQGERFTAVNLQHVRKARGEKRLEFRQHSGTLNGEKIVGWYRLMCEFIAETVRILRDNPVVPAAPVTTSVTPVDAVIVRRQRTARRAATRSVVVGHESRMPVIEAGTDYDRFLNAIAERGVVTQHDAVGFGWDETRLRVTAHWLRRNGAALVTTHRDGVLSYVGQNGARTRDDIFVNQAQVRRRIEVGAVNDTTVAIAPVNHAAASLAAQRIHSDAVLTALENASILDGVSPQTAGWYRQRREDLAGA